MAARSAALLSAGTVGTVKSIVLTSGRLSSARLLLGVFKLGVEG